ncbi:hypothetical protein DCAR_0727250 [Daucus carota subsp. sativus]|uniref:Uncharacterized protein n=1 Tax=Daucus carota subsp. sativus TaxID=79200 RepID=A0AAF0XJY2_DAUCS|nr:hypothetical protein DCAR_0727250 [Daucus carota subsp. sativus]
MSSDDRESRSGSAPFPPPASVSMTSPLGSSRRRLSSSFIPSTEPVRAERQLTWVSTRLGESRSAKHIDNGVAWELFGPIVLVHAASVSLEKDKLISELQESVQLRDLVLSAMQEELDNLCDQCQLPPMTSEERRMSNISDWAPSVVSSVDIQLQLDSEQDIYNLRMECEEKDTTIKELSENLHSSEAISSKRIAELEGIIRTKKSAITKLKKDMAVLEQKVSYLTRLRRPSSLSSSKAGVKQLRGIKDNFLYDVDSATRALSSDSDCPPRTSSQAPNAKSEEIIVQNFKHSLVGDQKTRHAKSSNNVDKLTNQYQTFLQESPVGENSPNEIFDTESLPRLRLPTRSKDAILQK